MIYSTDPSKGQPRTPPVAQPSRELQTCLVSLNHATRREVSQLDQASQGSTSCQYDFFCAEQHLRHIFPVHDRARLKSMLATLGRGGCSRNGEEQEK